MTRVLSDTAASPEDRYMLDSNHNPVCATDWAEWCKWMAGPLRPQWLTTIPPYGTRVHTFFLGIRFVNGAMFCTTISGGRFHGRSGDAATYEEALAQHARVVSWLRNRSIA